MPLAALFGSVVAGPLVDKFGRRFTLMHLSWPYCLCRFAALSTGCLFYSVPGFPYLRLLPVASIYIPAPSLRYGCLCCCSVNLRGVNLCSGSLTLFIYVSLALLSGYY